MLCPICGKNMGLVFRSTILGKHDVQYFCCPSCEFLCTENPYWLEEAYSSAIASTDVGLVARNIAISKKLSVLLYFIFDTGARGVDVAGGYGMLCRMMRDIGFDYYWVDKFCDNLFAAGYEAEEKNGYDVASFFEAIEHVPDPLRFCRELIATFDVDTLIFTTELYDGPPPQPASWWYYSMETGQHISFYTHNTLQNMAKALGMQLHSHGDFHILTTKKIHSGLISLLCSRWASLLLPAYVKKRMTSRIMEDFRAAQARIKL